MPNTIKHRRPLMKPRKPRTGITEDNVRIFRRTYGISQALLARLLDVSLRSVSANESRLAAPSKIHRSLIQTRRLCAALADAMDPSFVGSWLDQPNAMLENLKPVEAIERGQLDLVWQLVEGLRSGSTL